jgi:hypothetical protein
LTISAYDIGFCLTRQKGKQMQANKRIKILLAASDNKDCPVATQICDWFLRMLNNQKSVTFADKSQPMETSHG